MGSVWFTADGIVSKSPSSSYGIFIPNTRRLVTVYDLPVVVSLALFFLPNRVPKIETKWGQPFWALPGVQSPDFHGNHQEDRNEPGLDRSS